VLCPNCGQRKVYQSAEAHDPKQDAEATKTSRRIQFSTGKKKSMQPKSWLNEWASRCGARSYARDPKTRTDDALGRPRDRPK